MTIVVSFGHIGGRHVTHGIRVSASAHTKLHRRAIPFYPQSSTTKEDTMGAVLGILGIGTFHEMDHSVAANLVGFDRILGRFFDDQNRINLNHFSILGKEINQIRFGGFRIEVGYVKTGVLFGPTHFGDGAIGKSDGIGVTKETTGRIRIFRS